MRKFPSYNLNRKRTGNANPADRTRIIAEMILVKIMLCSFNEKNGVFIMKQKSVKCYGPLPQEVFS